MGQETRQRQGGLWRMTLAFQSTGYRWLWGGNLLAAFGRTLDSMTTGWLVLELTNSPFWVGVAAGMRGLGMLVLGPLGGIIADRLDRRRTLIMCYGLQAVTALTAGTLVLLDLIRLWQIILLVAAQSVAQGIQWPSRNTLIYDLVGRQAFLNAIAANFVAMNTTRVLAPLGGGFLIAALGVGPAYFTVGAFELAALSLLLPVRVQQRQRVGSGSVWNNLREAVRYVLGDRPVRSVLTVILITEAFGFSAQHMLPVVARDVLQQGATGFGFLTSAWGLGAVVGSALVVGFPDLKGRGWYLIGCALLFGIFLVLFSTSRSLPLSLGLLVLTGGVGSVYDSMASTLTQTLVPDQMRGRMVGLHGLLIGTNPAASFEVGYVASVLGAPLAITLGATLVILNALWHLRLGPDISRSEARSRTSPASEGGGP